MEPPGPFVERTEYSQSSNESSQGILEFAEQSGLERVAVRSLEKKMTARSRSAQQRNGKVASNNVRNHSI